MGRASRASSAPISVAALPPTPASTSSKTRVATGSAPASTTSRASMTRDSSPPEAPFWIGSSGAPRCAFSSNSTESKPSAPARTRRPSTVIASAWSAATSVWRDRDPQRRPAHRQVRELRGGCGAQLCGLGRPGLGRSTAGPHDIGGQLLVLLAQRGDRLVRDVQRGELHRRRGGPVQHRVDVGAVPAGQGSQHGLPLHDRLQPLRVGVERVEEAGQLHAHIRQQHAGLAQRPGQRLQLLVAG